MGNMEQTLKNMNLTQDQYNNLKIDDLKKLYNDKVFYNIETGQRVKVIEAVDTCMIWFKFKNKKKDILYYKEFDKIYSAVEHALVA